MKCDWALNNLLMEHYHDTEWGTPVHDDRLLFEHLVLDVFQAGLSWQTILNKRENFRKAFDNFEVEKVAGYKLKKVESLLKNPGIIRNRLKIEATIHNARQFLKIVEKYGSFDTYIWSFTEGKTLHNQFSVIGEIPVKTELSDQLSKSLKHHGFKFVGSTIVYAIMQAIGIVNDHLVDCYRYKELHTS